MDGETKKKLWWLFSCLIQLEGDELPPNFTVKNIPLRYFITPQMIGDPAKNIEAAVMELCMVMAENKIVVTQADVTEQLLALEFTQKQIDTLFLGILTNRHPQNNPTLPAMALHRTMFGEKLDEVVSKALRKASAIVEPEASFDTFMRIVATEAAPPSMHREKKIKEHSQSVIEEMEANKESLLKGEESALKYPLDGLNDILGGVTPSLTVSVMPTNTGKTTFSIALARSFARQKYRFLYITTETAEKEILRRILGSYLNLLSDDMRRGKILERLEDGRLVRNKILDISSIEFQSQMNAYNREIADLTAMGEVWFPPINLTTHLLKEKIEQGIAMAESLGNKGFAVIIDYAQTDVMTAPFQPQGKKDNYKATENMAAWLRTIADAYQIPIVCMSQGKTPGEQDFDMQSKWSSQLTDKATDQLYFHREISWDKKLAYPQVSYDFETDRLIIKYDEDGYPLPHLSHGGVQIIGQTANQENSKGGAMAREMFAEIISPKNKLGKNGYSCGAMMPAGSLDILDMPMHMWDQVPEIPLD